jgi:hypothetical protein
MLRAIERSSGRTVNMPDETAMGIGLRDETHWPVSAAGDPLTVQAIEGGHLVEGLPLNAWYRGVLYPEQVEILDPLWADGTVPRPSEAIMQSLTIEPMDEGTREEWDRWRETESLPAYGQMDWPKVLLIGGGVVVIGALLFAGDKRPDFLDFDFTGGDDGS